MTRILHTPQFPYLRFGLYSPNQYEYENKRYTIEKPYKIATRNSKKSLNLPKIVKFLFKNPFKLKVQSPKERYTTPVFAKHKSLCTSKNIESTKTNNISFKSPIKLQPEMQKKI